jgi:uncharacterized protein (TIGR02118 family)
VRFLVLYDPPSDPAFEQHCREIHIPLAEQLPGVRRHTLSRDVAAVRGGVPCYLVAELAPGGGVRSLIFEVEEIL